VKRAAVARSRPLIQERLLPPVIGAAAAAALLVVAVRDPGQPGHYPSCPLYAVSGLYCPGCGTLRCLHALTHGDLGAALGFNVLTVLALPYLAFTWAAWLRRSRTGVPRGAVAPAWVLWSVLCVVVVFWVLRNLPPFGALAP